MRSYALLRAASLAFAFVLAGAGSAFAGTAAWLLSDAPMIAGPGIHYKSVGNGAEGALVSVERCSRSYCKVDFEGRIGWVSLSNLSFGLEARHLWTGMHFDRKSGNGSACLYSGPNFTGDYLCRDSGFVVTDLARTDLDNLFMSVTIDGDASILVCRDLNFTSYCETLTKDTPTLSRFLSRNISSIRIF
jgi:hypothetical protein